MMQSAFEVVQIAIVGAFNAFMRLVSVFNVDAISMHILFISTVFGLLVSPIVMINKLGGIGRRRGD